MEGQEQTKEATLQSGRASRRASGRGSDMLPDRKRPSEEKEADKAVVLSMAELLADLHVLRLKTKQIHWNVEGPLFDAVHRRTEELYKVLAKHIDELAERIRAKGFYVPASFRTYEEMTPLQFAEEACTTEEMLTDLVNDNEMVGARLKEAIHLAEEKDDAATADILTKFLTMLDEKAWMFRSLLGGRSEAL